MELILKVIVDVSRLILTLELLKMGNLLKNFITALSIFNKILTYILKQSLSLGSLFSALNNYHSV